MSALALLALFAVGLLVGFVAGLIGIGGGVLIVPFLYFFYQHSELAGFALPETLQVAVAHATSLFVILPTAARGSWSYSRAGLVEWRVALTVALAAMVGGVAGARVAILLPGELLKLIFGLLLVASGAQMVSKRGTTGERPVSTNLLATTATGLLVGLLSGMMGVGGGILALPLLIYLLQVELRRAAATSLTIVGFAAVGGLITYAVSGVGVAGRAPYSLGYIHYAAGIPILIGSLLSVHWGTVVNQRLHTRLLRYIFAAVFVALGLRFIMQNIGVVFG